MSQEDTIAGMAAVLDAQDDEGLAKQLGNMASGLGFDMYLLGMEISRPMVAPIVHTTSAYPAAWQRLYKERNYIAVDPTVRHCRQSNAPLIWSNSLRTDELADFWNEAHRHGIAHGLSFPSHDRSGVSCMVSLARDQPLPTHPEEATRIFTAARLLSTCAHAASMRILVPGLLEKHDPQLSKREKECIAWAAQGKTSTEIGEQLHISVPTVMFHFNKAVRKLGVRNRMQAIALSVAMGLVAT